MDAFHSVLLAYHLVDLVAVKVFPARRNAAEVEVRSYLEKVFHRQANVSLGAHAQKELEVVACHWGDPCPCEDLVHLVVGDVDHNFEVE